MQRHVRAAALLCVRTLHGPSSPRPALSVRLGPDKREELTSTDFLRPIVCPRGGTGELFPESFLFPCRDEGWGHSHRALS